MTEIEREGRKGKHWQMRLLCLSKVNLEQTAEAAGREVEKSSRIDVFVQFGFVV